eukprot:gene26242-biopygen15222
MSRGGRSRPDSSWNRSVDPVCFPAMPIPRFARVANTHEKMDTVM